MKFGSNFILIFVEISNLYTFSDYFQCCKFDINILHEGHAAESQNQEACEALGEACRYIVATGGCENNSLCAVRHQNLNNFKVFIFSLKFQI